LERSEGVTVRIRKAGEKAYVTIKGASKGAARPEFEYEIPLGDAEAMLRGIVLEAAD
jgi:adenylate cyclase